MKLAKTIQILLIEDNPGDSRLFAEYLEELYNFEYSLVVADSLKKGLDAIKKQHFSIIFTDLNLPDSNHLSTLERILEENPPYPIIIITGLNDRDLGIESVKMGADDYLFKSEINSHLLEKTIIHSIERNRLSRKLIQSETRFRRMFEYSTLGIYRSSGTGKLIEVNNAFAGMFGYDSPEEMVNTVKDIPKQLYVNPEIRHQLFKDFQENKIKYAQTEVQFLKKDRSEFTGLLHMRVANNKKGDNFVVEGYVQDITQEKRANEQVRESLNFLKELMDNIPSPVYAKDKNLRYTGCNKEFEKFIGITESNLIGHKLTDVKKDEDGQFLDHMDMELLKSKKRQVFEHTLKFASGDDRAVVLYKNVITNHKGQVNGIIGIMIDITDKKNAMEQLREELSINEAMSGLSQQLLEPGIAIHEISNLILDYTKSFTKSSHGYAGTIDPENGDLVLHTFTEMIANGCDVENQSIRFSKHNGRYPKLWGHSLNTLKPFYTNNPAEHESSGGTPAGHIPLRNFLSVPVMIHNQLAGQIALANSEQPFDDDDLDNLVRLSRLFSLAIEKERSMDELIRSKELAERSDKLKSAFLANMSHEIRTPLNAIVGFSQMLGEEGIDLDETREFKKVIIKNTDLLLRLINDIIEMSMIEAGELKIHPEPRLVEDTIRQIFETWKFKDEVISSEGKINFKLDMPEKDDNKSFKIDFLRFSQIIDNLLMNAFRFTSSGEVTLGYKLVGDNKVQVFVSDTGVGISKEHQSTIFDRFRQVDELRVRPFSGTGLGLAISKKLTERLGGNIHVDSSPGEGSTFYLTFPVTYNKQQVTQPQIFKPEQPATTNATIEGKRLLIVEDNDSSFEFLEILLRKQGAKIQRAVTGKEAVEKNANNNNDIILMDLQLPEMSGFDAIKKIRETNHTVPIIVQTAFSEQTEREKAFDAGCDAYLVKPITKRKLEAALLKFC
jgi:PAS domain S-box-containing protein